MILTTLWMLSDMRLKTSEKVTFTALSNKLVTKSLRNDLFKGFYFCCATKAGELNGCA